MKHLVNHIQENLQINEAKYEKYKSGEKVHFLDIISTIIPNSQISADKDAATIATAYANYLTGNKTNIFSKGDVAITRNGDINSGNFTAIYKDKDYKFSLTYRGPEDNPLKRLISVQRVG